MGSVIRKFRVVNGKRERLPKWYGKYTDENGRRVERALSNDKSVARSMLANMEREVERTKAGQRDRYSCHARKPIGEHLQAYRAEMETRGGTKGHVTFTIGVCEKIIASCAFKIIADLSESRIKSWLQGQRDNRTDFGLTQTNRYLTAIKGFARWLWESKRWPDHPLVGLKRMNVETDPRHQRRRLDEKQLATLLETTRCSKRVDAGKGWRLTGEDRYYLYLTAALTGLRASELGSLRVRDFDFVAQSFIVLATNTKNKETDTLPLQQELALKLQEWIARRKLSPNDFLWGERWAEAGMGSKVVKRDLKECGLPYVDDDGRFFDFHSLRMQFITALAIADVPLKKAQDLARHSTPVLTANVYTKLTTTDLAESVNRLTLPKADDDGDSDAASQKIGA